MVYGLFIRKVIVFVLVLSFLLLECHFTKYLITTQKYSLRASNAPSDGKITIKNPYSFGACGILGTMLTPKILVYAKAGFAMCQSQIKYSALQNGENPNFKNFFSLFSLSRRDSNP